MNQLEQLVRNAYKDSVKDTKKLLIIPPDHTRLASKAGEITNILYEMFNETAEIHIIPALGTHFQMTPEQLKMMFGDKIPLSTYLVHKWKSDVVKVGTIHKDEINAWTGQDLNLSVDIEINKLLVNGGYDLIISIGQVVPHEVVGMANYTKNICVGVGGKDIINKSHFIGAVHGIENVIGNIDTPVRRLFNTSYNRFMKDIPLSYILTVVNDDKLKGIFFGKTDVIFERAAKMSQKENINWVDKKYSKVIAYLDPKKYKSTWIGNKAIYRTRKMIKDGGELIIYAPNIETFGEDPTMDKLIRKYGYTTSENTLKYVKENKDLQENLGAAAHLMHGTSEGRFKITLATDKMSKEEIEAVGFNHISSSIIEERYGIHSLNEGANIANFEEVYFVRNPALGLWSVK